MYTRSELTSVTWHVTEVNSERVYMRFVECDSSNNVGFNETPRYIVVYGVLSLMCRRNAFRSVYTRVS